MNFKKEEVVISLLEPAEQKECATPCLKNYGIRLAW